MAQTCNVCGASLGAPVYQSADNASITTMNKVIPGRTEVFYCGACGHLQTTELPDLDRYYASEYEINLNTDDDDQLYRVVDGRPVYRADHQARVLMEKVSFPERARVLDYGCAKAATLRKVLAARPGIVPMAFDVTDKYVPFWNKFVADGNWATFQPRAEWQGTVDVVLSFYALEHVRDPRKFLADVHALLKPGGTFYFIVPNAYANIADFVVADHINHFSAPSLRTMLARAGFDPADVDDSAHDAAFVVTARKALPDNRQAPDADTLRALRVKTADMARYWQNLAGRIRQFEDAIGPADAVAIYGAGFYGNLIASVLRQPDRVRCFVDQNRFLQGNAINGRPILAPENLPGDVTHVLVGLNPRIAESTIRSIKCWHGRQLEFLFL